MPGIAPPSFPFGTFQEAWLWNGFSLNQPFWNISSFGGGRNSVPTLRGADVQVPYRAGQSWRPKYPDERTIALTMWLDGSGSANNPWPAADPRLAFNDNWQALRAQFFTRSATGHVQGQLQRNYYRTQGTPKLVTSTAMAELAGSMDLTMNGRFGAAFTVDLLLSDPYFYGALQTQAITTAGGTITNLGEGVAGEGFPSAVHAFTVTCTAPTTVTNTTAGVSFTIASGPSFPVTVDQLNGTVIDNAGVNQISKFSHLGSRLWMCLLSGANVIANTAGTATFAYNPPYV
jgi:hypothetical protein